MLIAGGLGLLFAIVRRRPADLVLLAFVIPFYLLIAGSQSTHLYYQRYMIPLLPLLAILAGRLLASVADVLPIPRLGRASAVLVASLALLTPALLDSLHWTAVYARGDTRLEALEWMEDHVPAGTKVFLVGNPLLRSALSVPLRDTDTNAKRIADNMRKNNPAKAEVLDLARRAARGVPFDLVTVRHFQVNEGLEAYRRRGVVCFILPLHYFDPERLRRDTKRPPALLRSRMELYRALHATPGVEKVLSLDPDRDGLFGPAIEIYRLD